MSNENSKIPLIDLNIVLQSGSLMNIKVNTSTALIIAIPKLSIYSERREAGKVYRQ